MLLKFTVKNFLSIKSEQVFSLVASKLRSEGGYLMKSSAVADESVLPAAIMYGANASGKSNFLSALGFMREKILYSQSRDAPKDGTERVAFVLDKRCISQPSSFEAAFIVEGVRYHYGFEANDEAYLAEWLYAFPNNKQQILFTRSGNVIDPKRGLKGSNKLIASLVRPNSLFLSAAAQNGHPLLTKIVDFFGQMYGDQQPVPGYEIENYVGSFERDDRVVAFLRMAGTGISEYRTKEMSLSDRGVRFRKEFNETIKRIYGREAEFALPEVQRKVELGHRSKGGAPIFLPFQVESTGTQRLLAILGPALRALDDGSLIAIDEISNSLHTKACEMLIGLFCDPETNPRGAQLIATTHDTNLLHSEFLRRDEIWFAEKDGGGSTHIFPLTDIKTRKSDDFGKGYLQGRYGAIPFSGDIRPFAKK